MASQDQKPYVSKMELLISKYKTMGFIKAMRNFQVGNTYWKFSELYSDRLMLIESSI